MTIDTSREAVERLLDGVTPGPWKELSGANHRIMASYMCINGLSAMFTLARIDNPDDAERGYTDDAYNPDTAEANTRFIAAARELVPALMAERDAALAEVARLSHALAAETAKREAMEAELRTVETDLAEAEDKFHIASFYIIDDQTRQCVMDRVKWMAKAGSRVRATLATHGSK